MQLSLEETQQLRKNRALQQFSMYEARAAPEHQIMNTGWGKKEKKQPNIR